MDLKFSSDPFFIRSEEEYADMTLFRQYVISCSAYYDAAALGGDPAYYVELFFLYLCER